MLRSPTVTEREMRALTPEERRLRAKYINPALRGLDAELRVNEAHLDPDSQVGPIKRRAAGRAPRVGTEFVLPVPDAKQTPS